MGCELYGRVADKIKTGRERFISWAIDTRNSGEPFFGVQTVFASRIDKWAKERETVPPEEDIGGRIEYKIKTLF